MNYCSTCGSSNIVFDIPEGDHMARYCCKNCGRIHYDNPKIVVGCLPIFEEKVLLCRRAIEPRKGFWNLPAGFMENGETVQEGAIREVWEETQAKVELIRLHCLYNLPHVNQVYIIFLARLLEQNLVTSTRESLEIRLFHQTNIPWNEIAFTSTQFALEKYFAYRHYEGTHLGCFVLKDETSSWSN